MQKKYFIVFGCAMMLSVSLCHGMKKDAGWKGTMYRFGSRLLNAMRPSGDNSFELMVAGEKGEEGDARRCGVRKKLVGAAVGLLLMSGGAFGGYEAFTHSRDAQSAFLNFTSQHVTDWDFMEAECDPSMKCRLLCFGNETHVYAKDHCHQCGRKDAQAALFESAVFDPALTTNWIPPRGNGTFHVWLRASNDTEVLGSAVCANIYVNNPALDDEIYCTTHAECHKNGVPRLCLGNDQTNTLGIMGGNSFNFSTIGVFGRLVNAVVAACPERQK